MTRRLRLAGGFALWWLLEPVATAQAAYIDPATTSYIIQVVSGLVITLSVAIGVFFRRIQLFVVTFRARLAAGWIRLTSHRTPVDSTQNAAEGQADADDIPLPGVVPPPEPSPGPRRRSAPRSDLNVTKRQFLFGENRPRRQRLALAALTGFAAPFVFILFGFLDLFQQNRTDFPFDFTVLIWPALGLSLGGGALITLACYLVRGRVFDVLVSLVLGITLAGWVQANFLNLNFGPIGGRADFHWEYYLKYTLVNTLIWLVIIVLPVGLRLINRRVWSAAVSYVAALLMLISSVSLLTDYATSGAASAQPPSQDYLSYQGAFDASAKNNAYIFILDSLDQDVIAAVLARDPDFFAPLDGFTRFDNYISRYTRTFPSAINILTGQDYDFARPADQWVAQAYREGDFLPDLRRAGYSTNIYATNLYSYWAIDDVAMVADNINTGHPETGLGSVVGGMAQLAGFRFAPHAMKPTLWSNSTEFDFKLVPNPGEPLEFADDDYLFYQQLQQRGIRIAAAADQPRFSYFHLHGSHDPLVLTENIEPVPPQSWSTDHWAEQTMGAFRILYAYLDGLRELGLYEQATVVITGDHPNWAKSSMEPLRQPALTGMFVKPAGNAATPLQVSLAPIDNDNIQATILHDAGLGGHGPTVFEIPEDSLRPRTMFHRRGNWDSGRVLARWEVIGDARQWENWHLRSEAPCLFWWD